jgi:FMN reductase
MDRISVVVGNPRPRSRTLHVARALALTIAARTGATRCPSVDLAEYSRSMFDWSGEEIPRLDQEIRASSLVIVASPTYKASYTGLLKCFLDRVPSGAWAGVTAIPLMTTAVPGHAGAVGLTLRPVLEELGARMPTSGVTFHMPEFAHLGRFVNEWADVNVPRLGLGQAHVHPRPVRPLSA